MMICVTEKIALWVLLNLKKMSNTTLKTNKKQECYQKKKKKKINLLV